MLGMWCAQVGMGILDKLAAHKQHNNSIHQLMHLKLLSNQMQATCQYVTEYSNSMRLACSRPLPQARGGPQPMWWLCGGLAGPCQEIKIKLVWPTMVWPMALQPMPYTVVWGPWLWAFWAHSVFFKPTKWHKKCVPPWLGGGGSLHAHIGNCETPCHSCLAQNMANGRGGLGPKAKIGQRAKLSPPSGSPIVLRKTCVHLGAHMVPLHAGIIVPAGKQLFLVAPAGQFPTTWWPHGAKN